MAAYLPGGRGGDRAAKGTVLVADTLHCPDRPVIPCPAGVLLEGELRRRGVATAVGPLYVDHADVQARPASVFAVTFSAVLPVACGGQAGLGAAADIDDRAGRLAAGTAVADWLSAARSRIVLLAAPRSFRAGVERAVEAVTGPLWDGSAPPRSARVVEEPIPALADLAEESELVLMLGRPDSASAAGLTEIVRRHDTPAYLIDDASDIQPGWLAGVDIIGLTADADTPPSLVDGVLGALGGLGPLQVAERITAHETTHFAYPPPARRRPTP